MLQLAFKNILFRKMRTLLTILGVASSITLVMFMNGILVGTEKSYIGSFANMAGQIRVQPKSEALNGNSTDTLPVGAFLDRSTMEKILAAAGGTDPARTSAVVVQTLINSTAPSVPAPLVLAGVEPGHEDAILLGLEMAEGEGKLTGEHDVILGAATLKELAKQTGSTPRVGELFTLPSTPGEWRLVGIGRKRDALTDTLAVVPLKAAQQAFGRGDTVNYVTLGYPVDGVQEAAERLKAELSTVDVATADALLEAVDKGLTAQRAFFRMINTTVYLTATAIIFMVMYTAVMERTREIGTMRAVGASRWAVVGEILIEALLFVFTGALIASVMGWVVLVPQWDFLSTPEYIASAAQTLGAALLVALGSSLYPAIRAARINPLEALRYE